MSSQIIGTPASLHGEFDSWLTTPAGKHLTEWSSAEFDRAVVDVFGYHALQLGLPSLNTLSTNRMPHPWIALDDCTQTDHPTLAGRSLLVSDFAALPFPEASLDLITLPHTLELSADPHGTLGEVNRVLVPEGRVVICGLNPTSLWGLRQSRAKLYQRFGVGELFVPNTPEWIGYRRLRDWLRLLSFEVESVRFGGFRPAVQNLKWLERTAWMDALGERWWPILGGVYFVVAVKRVRGMKLMGRAWKAVPHLANAPVSIANRAHSTGTETRTPFESD